MIPPIQLSAALSGRLSGAWVLCCVLLASSGAAVSTECPAQVPQPQNQPRRPSRSRLPPMPLLPWPQSAGTPVPVLPSAGAAPGKRQQREAEAAYLAGAKKLEHGDLDAAEREFVRALNLNPQNSSYAIAISVTREHRLTELVQQATKARQAGDQARAETLLAQAREIDPTDPLVLEHVEPVAGGDVRCGAIGRPGAQRQASRRGRQFARGARPDDRERRDGPTMVDRGAGARRPNRTGAVE